MKRELSVVMSVYNGEKYLKGSIESILNQTYNDFEFIIIDDGSTDNSKKIIKSYDDRRIILLEQKTNKGLSSSLNRGIREAEGKYIARMDADDISSPERFEAQLKVMKDDPKIVLLGTGCIFLTEEDDEICGYNVPEEDEELRNVLKYRSPFIHGSVIFRKDIFLKTRGYDEKIVHHFEDIVLWNEISQYGELRNINKAYYKYRIGVNSITNITSNQQNRKLQIMHKYLQDNALSEKDKNFLVSLKKGGGNKKRKMNYYISVANAYLCNTENTLMARKYLFRAIKLNFFNKRVWLNLLASFLPAEIIKKIKKRKG